MARPAEPFSIIKRPKTKFWYYKLGGWKGYKSTGKTLKSDAISVALEALDAEQPDPSGPTLRKYAAAFFVWESCPHVRRLVSEGKSTSKSTSPEASVVTSVEPSHRSPSPWPDGSDAVLA